MTATAEKKYTIQEYLELEVRSGERHEYYNGKPQPMAGGTINHNRITRNIIQHLGNALDSTDFALFGSDQKVYLPDFHFYLYPDAVVVTNGPVVAEQDAQALINPLLIIEVLSRGTEVYDRGDKFAYYCTLPTFKEYVLIRQTAPHVTSFFREAPDLWRESEVKNMEQEVLFRSVEVRLALQLIYRKVEFPAAG